MFCTSLAKHKTKTDRNQPDQNTARLDTALSGPLLYCARTSTQPSNPLSSTHQPSTHVKLAPTARVTRPPQPPTTPTRTNHPSEHARASTGTQHFKNSPYKTASGDLRRFTLGARSGRRGGATRTVDVSRRPPQGHGGSRGQGSGVRVGPRYGRSVCRCTGYGVPGVPLSTAAVPRRPAP